MLLATAVRPLLLQARRCCRRPPLAPPRRASARVPAARAAVAGLAGSLAAVLPPADEREQGTFSVLAAVPRAHRLPATCSRSRGQSAHQDRLAKLCRRAPHYPRGRLGVAGWRRSVCAVDPCSAGSCVKLWGSLSDQPAWLATDLPHQSTDLPHFQTRARILGQRQQRKRMRLTKGAPHEAEATVKGHSGRLERQSRWCATWRLRFESAARHPCVRGVVATKTVNKPYNPVCNLQLPGVGEPVVCYCDCAGIMHNASLEAAHGLLEWFPVA